MYSLQPAFAYTRQMVPKMSCQANLLSDVFMGRSLKSIGEETEQIAKRNQDLIGLVSILQASQEALQEQEAELAVQRTHILQSISSTGIAVGMNTSQNIDDSTVPEQDLFSRALQGCFAMAYGHSAAYSEPALEEEVQQPLSLKAALARFSTPRHEWVYVDTNTLWACAA